MSTQRGARAAARPRTLTHQPPLHPKKRVRRWSARVSRTSDALDLDPGVFKLKSATAIAASLERSASRSRRRKGTVFSSAMSMLVFYINRAGKSLSHERRALLERAKTELRRLNT